MLAILAGTLLAAKGFCLGGGFHPQAGRQWAVEFLELESDLSNEDKNPGCLGIV